ncbi:hypothetical protein DSC45_24420 [Streptomyces sp. YIM 130001]|uniref:acyl-CoA carboxylase subunit epsilon n=1 Tax=Streptomyces sp. YIM 130001 TaxID=2259644 RepID=UPI000E65C343|nr:acyl-CoA carboxylase subunit epsilon [Streptomyces sp. YIM 130001]RII13160.1 hypothetical protein DSC45_24420 [Streptomyces sp. YIM 130001]
MRDGQHVLFRVERGQPREEELAALAVVLLSLSGAGEEDEAARPLAESQWWNRPQRYSAPDSWH